MQQASLCSSSPSSALVSSVFCKNVHTRSTAHVGRSVCFTQYVTIFLFFCAVPELVYSASHGPPVCCIPRLRREAGLRQPHIPELLILTHSIPSIRRTAGKPPIAICLRLWSQPTIISAFMKSPLSPYGLIYVAFSESNVGINEHRPHRSQSPQSLPQRVVVRQ